MGDWIGRHKWMILVIAVLSAFFVFTACGGGEEGGEATGTPEAAETGTPAGAGGALKIGLLDAFTGDLSDFGKAHENSVRLAVKEINEAGGVLGQDVEVVTGDTATDPSQGVAEANRLVNVEGVNAIIGALSSGVTLQVAESVAGPNSILEISQASTSPGLTEAKDNDFLFRTTISDVAQGIVLAGLAEEEGLASVCTMYINNPYGEGLSDAFAANFTGEVTAKVPHESEQATYASELNQCGDAEAIAAISYPESAGVFLREALEAGDITSFLFVDGTKSDKMFDTLGWESFDGMAGTAPGATLASPTGSAFDSAYEAEYGDRPPLPFMREAYDAVYLIALAAETAGSTDPTAMRDVLREVANPEGEVVNPGVEGYAAALELIQAGEDINYEGAAHSCDFDENGDVPVGGIEVWRIDAANQQLVTERVFRVDLTGETPQVTEE